MTGQLGSFRVRLDLISAWFPLIFAGVRWFPTTLQMGQLKSWSKLPQSTPNGAKVLQSARQSGADLSKTQVFLMFLIHFTATTVSVKSRSKWPKGRPRWSQVLPPVPKVLFR